MVTARPANARNLADKYGFSFCSGDSNEILKDNEINTVFIATRHDSHAKYVIECLQNNKNVFVEKPLCMFEEELEEIRKIQSSSGKMLMVGFNRRFSPLIQTLASALHEVKDAPVAINYRINAGIVPPEHWVHDKTLGGGRILGEACHFIDLAMFLSGSPIDSVSALTMNDTNNLEDTTIISLHFKNGSIANISYFSNGNKDLNKEYLEVFFSGRVAVLDDFKTLKIFGKKPVDKKVPGQDKGHKAEVDAYIAAIRDGKASPISFQEQYISMLSTFKALTSITNKGERIYLN
ncbi:MAG TPA: Gfo/Idh/MocA family oxidoreductase [Bacteroidia bacterium]|nr:Gfo/Idh/MocA family oxidoreductase [Bacteroidia bacterium]